MSKSTKNTKLLGYFENIKPWLGDFIKVVMPYSKYLSFSMVVLLALIISGLVFKNHSETKTFSTQNGNWTIASNLVKGYGYVACEQAYFPFCGPSNNVTAMREPVPVFLMALARIIEPSHDSGLIMQILLYLGTISIIFFLLRRENIYLRIVATFFWTISIPVIDEIGNDAGHLAAVLFYMSGILFFLQGIRTEKRSLFFVAGLLMGLASLSRTILMGTAFGLGIILAGIQIVNKNKKQFLNSLFFLAVISFVLSPWIIRNKIVLGSPVIGSTLTGYNIYRMNYFLGEEPFRPRYVGGDEAYRAISELVKNSDLTGLENEAQMQDFYSRAGKNIVLAHPLRYIELSLYRFGMLWFDISVKEAYGLKMYDLDYIALVEQIIFLTLGLWGAIKRFKDYWPLVITVILGSGAYMAVNAQLRYLVDLMPSIVILAALSLPHIPLPQRLRNMSNKALLNSTT